MDVAGIDEEMDVICWLIIPTPSWDRWILPQRIPFALFYFLNQCKSRGSIFCLSNIYLANSPNIAQEKQKQHFLHFTVVTSATNPWPFYWGGDNNLVDICGICNNCGNKLNIFSFHMNWHNGAKAPHWSWCVPSILGHFYFHPTLGPNPHSRSVSMGACFGRETKHCQRHNGPRVLTL